MAYLSREIIDRVAIGDDCFIIEELGDGRVRLIPSPDAVSAVGTDINKALLQLIEDRVVFLMNRVFSDISSNPFNMIFDDISGLDVTGIWNNSEGRIEC